MPALPLASMAIELATAVRCIALAALGVACGGGSRPEPAPPAGRPLAPTITVVDEVEPNQIPVDASALYVDSLVGEGDLAYGDVDLWTFEGRGGDVIAIELFASRYDQAVWQSQCALPRFQVFGPQALELAADHDSITGLATRDHDVARVQLPVDGYYFVRVEAEGGWSKGRYALAATSIDVGAVVLEGEGLQQLNDSVTTAKKVKAGALRGSLHCTIGDVDVFSIDVGGPSILSVDVVAWRRGLVPIGASQAPLDVDGWFWPSADPTERLFLQADANLGDPRGAMIAKQGGKQLVELVRQVPFGAVVDGEYFLDLGVEPYASIAEHEPNDAPWDALTLQPGVAVEGGVDLVDLDFFRIAGVAGQRVLVRLFDARNLVGAADAVELVSVTDRSIVVLDTAARACRLVVPPSGEIVLYARSNATHYALVMTEQGDPRWELEPNDVAPTDAVLAEDECVAGTLDGPDDRDVFALEAERNEFVRLVLREATSPDGIAPLDGVLTVLDLQGNELAAAASHTSICTQPLGTALDDPTGDSERTRVDLAFRAPATGVYRVIVGEPDDLQTETYLLERR